MVAKIVSKKKADKNRMILKVILDLKESLSLQGNLKSIHIFSSDLCKTKTEIIETGLNNSTKYFMIPKELMLKIPLKFTKWNLKKQIPLSCQKIETEKNCFFIYTISKKFE